MIKGNLPTRFRIYISLMLLASVMLTFCHACNLLEPPVESGSVLFQDDFSRSASGWDRYSNDSYLTDYEEGGYRIAIFTTETNVWSRPHLDFGDTLIQVLATKLEGPDDNVFGVLCRYQDARNFYFFLISSDGYHGIGIYQDGEEILLSNEAMLPSEAINQGEARNHIRADCVGEELSLYINGALVAQATATDWAHGDVGLIAGTYDKAGTDILFENFSVLLP
ncbi:MAG: hypothetical protein AMJ88_03145 [Anaerolineae bacterium SM23_ 63]|nr:MAG: hypothetical protein AMJ88_03145 [Anaerolineae bacterium SM23_ 63]HEY47556.1 hypothetical protein [Anaerolineae bacterium]